MEFYICLVRFSTIDLVDNILYKCHICLIKTFGIWD